MLQKDDFFCNFSPFVYVDATGTLLPYQISWECRNGFRNELRNELRNGCRNGYRNGTEKRVPNLFSAIGMGILVKQISETDDLIPDDQNGGHCYEMANE